MKDVTAAPWPMASISEVCDVIAGQSPKAAFYNNEGLGLPFYQGKKEFTNRLLGAPTTWTTAVTKKAGPGDILMSVRAPVGPINEATQTICIGRGLAAIRVKQDKELDQNFLWHALLWLQPTIQGNAGAVFESISKADIERLAIPFPPPEEQRRTVAILDKAFEGITRTRNDAESQLCDLHELRQTILNLAVRGKLVEQDPADEPAGELLKRIAAQLGDQKNSRGRKSKPLPDIDLADAPYELRDGWAWARFPELGKFGRGKSKHRPRNDPVLYSDGIHPMIQTGDVARSGGRITTHTKKYNDVGLAQSMLWPKGTLCITIAANIADSGILDFDSCFPDSVVGFIPVPVFENARYFEYFVRTAKANLLEFAPAAAQKNINLEILTSVLIPLPPLAEQQRVVERIDKAFEGLDRAHANIKAKLRDLDDLQGSLLQRAFAGELT